MASIVSGYSYDIFISYRQKDNTYDGWVTEFVGNLRKELEATFKNEVNIFFDANPIDGLHETHDVDDSLRDKLKCLVFIPIISQTYCDPSCFAWKNELLSFKQMANDDAIGMKVKLSGGNVASRILPVVIHELDLDDRKLLEGELGPIRSVDFVFSSSGVNRPLRSKDDDLRADSSKQPLYRDQVNKVANAVKGLIAGIRQPGTGVSMAVHSQESSREQGRPSKLMKATVIGTLVLLMVVAGYFYIDARYRTPTSIAVLPFADMSPKHDQEWFADGLSEELINMLTRVPTLEVKARTSSFAFKGKDEDIRSIADKLSATHVLEGSVRQMGDRIKVTAQLIRASDGNHMWSETFESKTDDIFAIQDEIANAVVKALRRTLFEQVPELRSHAVDPRAINFYLQGRYNTIHHKTDLAIRNYWSAIRIDSLYAKAWAGLAWTYTTMSPTDSLSGKEILRKRAQFARKAIALEPQDPDAMRAMIQLYLGKWEWKKFEVMAREAIQAHPNNAEVISFASIVDGYRGNYQPVKLALEKAIRIDPLNYLWHVCLGDIYMLLGDLGRAEASMKTGLSLGRDVPGVMAMMASHAVKKKEYNTALAYLDSAESNGDPWFPLQKFYPLYAMGKTKKANQLLDSIRNTFGRFIPTEIATCYAFKKSYDSAFMYFELAKKDSSEALAYLIEDPRIPAEFRKDIRYKELVRFVGLDK